MSVPVGVGFLFGKVEPRRNITHTLRPLVENAAVSINPQSPGCFMRRPTNLPHTEASAEEHQSASSRLFIRYVGCPQSVCWIPVCIPVCFLSASNVGCHRRQISDLLDQSIQISSQCFVITADNRFILLCGFWDKSFRVYSTDTGS